jgi:hypothetical protein
MVLKLYQTFIGGKLTHILLTLFVLTGRMEAVKIHAPLSAVLICASHLPARLPVQ